MPWSWLKVLGSWGRGNNRPGKAGMRSFIEHYARRVCGLAAHSTRCSPMLLNLGAPSIDCPALLLCGEKDHAGDVKVFNRKWAAGEEESLSLLDTGAGITRMLIILAL